MNNWLHLSLYSHLANLTAGNLFVANAQHAATHMAWIEEGFSQSLEGSKPAEEQ